MTASVWALEPPEGESGVETKFRRRRRSLIKLLDKIAFAAFKAEAAGTAAFLVACGAL